MEHQPGDELTIDLVTGATSAIGRKLVAQLVAMGHEVRAILRTHPSKTNEWMTLPAKVKVYVADLTLKNENDSEVLEDACRDVDNIFHIASAVYNYKNTYDELININVIGTENLLNAYESANKGSSKPVHLIYASSVSVYGYKRQGELLSESSEVKPASPYAESKMMAEQVIKSFADANSKIRYSILRFGTFYGPGYKDSYFKMFKLLEQGRAIYISGGTNNVSLIHEDDAIDALLLAAKVKNPKNETYNISDGQFHTIKSLFELAATALGVQPPKRSVPHVVAKITSKIANINYDELEFVASNRKIDISKAKKELGFKPKHAIEKDGLLLVEEYKKANK
ncbi:MAG: NAD(P)-dependent oxidoreductase [Candidatus Marsarchaeota archaeon]|jgi:nucleoside-diphosphate-sugar epimerase|nr:NAD(P)-dependent oxidoreductase [Candidatus Marsarchaeota archaeon]